MRWKHRPEGSNWGDFGPDDELGRLNLHHAGKGAARHRRSEGGRQLLPVAAARLSRRQSAQPGARIRRSASPRSARRTAALSIAAVRGPIRDLPTWSATTACCCHTQYSTQWDALSHVGSEFDADGDGVAEIVFYNGWRGGEHIVWRGQTTITAMGRCSPFEGADAKRLGIEKMAERCVQGRAVHDRPARHSRRRRRSTSTSTSWTQRCDADKVTVEAGDMVCFHTGFATADPGDEPRSRRRKCCSIPLSRALDGRDPRLLEWVRDSGVAALIADNYAVERYPTRAGEGRRRAPAAA